MNVLHISRTMGQGGAEKIVYQLCCDNGEKNVIASIGGTYVDRLRKIGVSHYVIPDIDKKNPYLIFKTMLILNNIVRNENIEVIHTHHRMAAFYARLLQILNGKLKHVYTAHNVFYGKRSLMRFGLVNSKIIACGETVKENLIQEYGIDKKRVSLIYNAVDAPDYNTVDLSYDTQNRPCVCTIGRLSEQKGIDVFIKAIDIARKIRPNILGLIIGDGEDKNYLMELTKRLGAEDNIKFLGFRSDVFALIRSVDFVALCSRWEGFPLTPIETFSMKKSIIVSNIKNNLEIIKDGYNGKVFKKDDYIDLAYKINEMFDVEKRTDLEENAFLTYSEKYSYKQFIENYKKIYSGVSL